MMTSPTPKLTHDVIADLYPLYESGDVSSDTRALVVEYLAAHPDLAKELGGAVDWLPPHPISGPSEGTDKRALESTKKWLRFRSIALGLAIFTSALPLSFGDIGDGVELILWPEHRELCLLSAAFALLCWSAYFASQRKLRPKGF